MLQFVFLYEEPEPNLKTCDLAEGHMQSAHLGCLLTSASENENKCSEQVKVGMAGWLEPCGTPQLTSVCPQTHYGLNKLDMNRRRAVFCQFL